MTHRLSFIRCSVQSNRVLVACTDSMIASSSPSSECQAYKQWVRAYPTEERRISPYFVITLDHVCFRCISIALTLFGFQIHIPFDAIDQTAIPAPIYYCLVITLWLIGFSFLHVNGMLTWVTIVFFSFLFLILIRSIMTKTWQMHVSQKLQTQKKTKKQNSNYRIPFRKQMTLSLIFHKQVIWLVYKISQISRRWTKWFRRNKMFNFWIIVTRNNDT